MCFKLFKTIVMILIITIVNSIKHYSEKFSFFCHVLHLVSDFYFNVFDRSYLVSKRISDFELI